MLTGSDGKLTTGLLALCISVWACASGPKARQIVNTFPVPAGTLDNAYAAALQAFGELDLPIVSTDKASGTIATDWVALTNRWEYADCGSAGFAHSFRNLEARVTALVRTAGSQHEIRINTAFRADRWEGGLAQRVVEKRACVSTGELERAIHLNMQGRLRAAR